MHTPLKRAYYSSTMATISEINPKQLYFRDVRNNEKTGGKSCLISRHATSNDPNFNLAFQLSPSDSWWSSRFLTKAKFGIDSIREDGQQDPYKRTVQFTAEDPDLVPFLRSIEESVVSMAIEKSQDLWGKKTDESVVRHAMCSVVKDAPEGKEGELKPLVKTKIILMNPNRPAEEQKNVTKVFTAENRIAPCDEFPHGKIDLVPVEDPLRVVTRNSPCLAKVRVSSVWKSPVGLGISLMLTHLVVWEAPSETVQGALSLGGANVNVLRPIKVRDDAFEEDTLMEVM